MNTNLLSCGHPPTSDAGCGTGYATIRETNERICYACADARQVADLLTADRYVAYLKVPVHTPTLPDAEFRQLILPVIKGSR